MFSPFFKAPFFTAADLDIIKLRRPTNLFRISSGKLEMLTLIPLLQDVAKKTNFKTVEELMDKMIELEERGELGRNKQFAPTAEDINKTLTQEPLDKSRGRWKFVGQKIVL